MLTVVGNEKIPELTPILFESMETCLRACGLLDRFESHESKTSEDFRLVGSLDDVHIVDGAKIVKQIQYNLFGIKY